MELLLDMVWWHWMVLGLFLTALELVAPGSFFIIFFGVAALIVGLLDLLGLAGPVWVQWLLFSIVSVAALVFFRNPLLRLVRAKDQPDASLVNALITETAHALEDIPPDAVRPRRIARHRLGGKERRTANHPKGRAARCSASMD